MVSGLVACYQAIWKHNDKANNFLLKAVMAKIFISKMLIELGYNYTWQEMPEERQRVFITSAQKMK